MLGRFVRRLAGVAEAPGTGASGEASYLARFDREFAPLLGVRTAGFRLMFERLEARARQLDRPVLIVETGSVREAGQWDQEGQSTVLWHDFSRMYPARIHSVDIDPDRARLINGVLNLSDTVTAHTSDSVAFLHRFASGDPVPQIDLLYLDSYDLDVNNPYPSSLHHLKELTAVRPAIGPGTLVAVDDNVAFNDGSYIGKGMIVDEFLAQIGVPRIHTGYQFIWQF